MPFKDLFSARAELYSRYRPSYPEVLYTWLRSLVASNERAWDCATGNGQAARGLAAYFGKVIATDASESQIQRADADERITYHVASACASAIASSSVDAVTIAQAMHWIDPQCFFAEAKRVARGRAPVVIWGYGDPVMDSEPIDRLVHEYNRGTIESYWMPERHLLLGGYRSIPFPLKEVETPAITMEAAWTLEELAGYLRTWSATAAYAARLGRDPVIDVERRLADYWGKKEERHLVRWQLFIRAGYVS